MVLGGVAGVVLVVGAATLRAAERSNVKQYLRTASEFAAQHQYQEALGDFQKALELAPNSAAANSGMGNLYAGMRQCDKGIPYLQKALSIDPREGTALFGMGACYMDLQQHEAAIPYLQKALQVYPNNTAASKALAHAYVRRGVIAARQEQNQPATAAFQSALKLFQQLGDAKGIADMQEALNHLAK